MNIREVLDLLALAKAEQTQERADAIQASIARLDINSSEDRLFFINGYGHLIGLPTRPGTSSTATTGVPTNSIQGFAPGALFLNIKGSIGSLLYCNSGTFSSSTWTNIL